MTYDFSVLREMRKKRGLTIAALAEKAGVSYVALSKLERNKANPELKTLDRISTALEIPTHNLLALAERKHPVTAREQHRAPVRGTDGRLVTLEGNRICWVRGPLGVDGDDADWHDDDSELCFVLDGRLRITIHGTDYDLGAGEALIWDSMFDHRYEVLEPATFVSVYLPKRP